jgi:hypothetical protein
MPATVYCLLPAGGACCLQDEEAMLDALASGMVSALVMDEGWVRYITSRRCNFLAVGQPFQINDFVYGYNRRMQAALTEDMDRCALLPGSTLLLPAAEGFAVAAASSAAAAVAAG